MLSGPGLYDNGFPKVLNLRVLAPLSKLAFIIGAWLVLECISENSECVGVGGISKSSNLRVMAPPSRLALIIGAWFVLQGISKSFGFAGVGSAVEVGLYYWGVVCIKIDVEKP